MGIQWDNNNNAIGYSVYIYIYLKPTIPSGIQTVYYESYGPSSSMILPLKMGWIVRSFMFVTLPAGTKMCTQTNLYNTMI